MLVIYPSLLILVCFRSYVLATKSTLSVASTKTSLYHSWRKKALDGFKTKLKVEKNIDSFVPKINETIEFRLEL